VKEVTHQIWLQHYQRFATQKHCKSATLVVALGPEGGLDSSEVALLEMSGFSPVSLGQNILRAETAAIVAIATAAQTLTKMSKY